jgi:hypothetical protein
MDGIYVPACEMMRDALSMSDWSESLRGYVMISIHTGLNTITIYPITKRSIFSAVCVLYIYQLIYYLEAVAPSWLLTDLKRTIKMKKMTVNLFESHRVE